MGNTITAKDGINNNLLAIGGSGKLGKFCITRWLNKKIINKVWNFDINELNHKNVNNLRKNILDEDGYNELSNILRNHNPSKIIVFAGYDFPRSKDAQDFNSPFAANIIQSTKAWDVNCILPYLLLKSIDENKYKNITITLIGSIYGSRVPKKYLYSDKGDIFKPVIYGMCKSALEYLNKQASLHMSEINGRCNLIRFGGIDCNIEKKFKDRYSKISPSNSMVSMDSVYESMTFVAIKNINDLNGAIIDIDSGIRHT